MINLVLLIEKVVLDILFLIIQRLSDSLPLEKLLTLHNVIILIESVFNKGQNHYYFNIFSEKQSNKNINMIYDDKIDVFEEIDINKTNESKECDIWHYCFSFFT